MKISQDLCCWYTSKHTLRDCWRAAFSSYKFSSCISGLYTCAQQMLYYFFSPHLHLSCPYSLTLLFNPHGGLLCLAYVLWGSLFNTRCPSGVTFPGKRDDQHISVSAFVTNLIFCLHFLLKEDCIGPQLCLCDIHPAYNHCQGLAC